MYNVFIVESIRLYLFSDNEREIITENKII